MPEYNRTAFEDLKRQIAALTARAEEEQRMADNHMARALSAEAILAEVMEWIETYDPNFTDEPAWPELRTRIFIALSRSS